MTRKKDKLKDDKPDKRAARAAAPRRLSVSYGAFSCTLEGYDNPLAIVDALTDRFRAVAGSEPRFALAPPPLDLEMLRQIAEAELRRQVEAGLLDAATIIDLARAPAEATPHHPATRPEPEDAVLAEPPEAQAGPEERAATGAAPETDAGADIGGTETDAEARRTSRRAEVIAQLRAAVHQAATDHRRTSARRPADPATEAAKGELAPNPAPAVAPDPAPSQPAVAANRLPPLQLGPALRVDGTAGGAAKGAPRLPSAPSALLRAYPAFAAAVSPDQRLMATARYLTEIEGRIGFEAAHLIALLHANSSGTDGATCRAAMDRALAAGKLARLDAGRIGLAPGSF